MSVSTQLSGTMKLTHSFIEFVEQVRTHFLSPFFFPVFLFELEQKIVNNFYRHKKSSFPESMNKRNPFTSSNEFPKKKQKSKVRFLFELRNKNGLLLL